jgi:hypothetical protein
MAKVVQVDNIAKQKPHKNVAFDKNTIEYQRFS